MLSDIFSGMHFRVPRFLTGGVFATSLAGLGYLAVVFPLATTAGVVNPDLSAIGQLRAQATDDAASPDQNQPTLGLGEAEVLLSAPLNPYFNGWFTFSGGEDGVAVEEAYTTMVRGLPWGLGLKAGKYRLGFGKVNAAHPHAYPFIDPPRAWVSLMPGGEEGINEAAFQVSALLPTPGDWASTVSADVIQGNSFHPDDDRSRVGWLGRWSNSFLVGDAGALEAGVSGATGLDDIDTKYRGVLLGADLKAKFLLSNASQLTFQGEGAYRRSHAVDTPSGVASRENRAGFFALADYRHPSRINGGGLYEQWQREGEPSATDRAARVFVGYAVLEESTLFRLSLERLMPDGGPAVHTLSAQLLFSMGPHKPHQF
jgi:hypothetical protein